jgi:mono/diheme cytochrome c family protein
MKTLLLTIGMLAGSAALVPRLARPVEAHTLPLAQKQTPDGKAIYLKSCKSCHGVLGEPTKTALRQDDKIPNFTDAAFFKDKKDEEFREAVTKGKGKNMKGFAEKLSKEEIGAVVEYIHTLHK